MSDFFGDRNWFVVDDILTLQEQNDIGNLLTSNYFPWYLSEYYTVGKEHHDQFKHLPNVKDHIQMVHQFYSARDDDPEYKTEAVSDRTEIVDILIKKIAKYLKKDKLVIARAKANLLLKKKRGTRTKSSLIATSSQGITDDEGLTLGQKSLLG